MFHAGVSTFTVVRNRPLVGSHEVVPWDEIIVDTMGGFDLNKTVFTVPQSGLYLTHFSAGILPYSNIPPYTNMTVTMHGTAKSPNIMKTENGYNGEMMTSRDDIQWWDVGQRVYLSSNYTLSSDGTFQTSWSAVRIDNIMTSVVAFCLARTSNLAENYITPLPFTNVMLSISSAREIDSHQFVAPKYGTYFIMFSIALNAYTSSSYVSAYLQIDGNIKSMVYLSYPQTINERDISSNSVLLRLNEGSVVDLHYQSSYITDLYSDKHYQTTLSGFLYEPVEGFNVAWSVVAANSRIFYGPIAAFPFDTVLVDYGAVWNATTYTVTIPVHGIYWLKLSGASSRQLTDKLEIVLSVNTQQESRPIINVMEKMTNGGGNVRSHSIAVKLKKGDQLQVGVPEGFHVWTMNHAVSFCGFLIVPAR